MFCILKHSAQRCQYGILFTSDSAGAEHVVHVDIDSTPVFHFLLVADMPALCVSQLSKINIFTYFNLAFKYKFKVFFSFFILIEAPR